MNTSPQIMSYQVPRSRGTQTHLVLISISIIAFTFVTVWLLIVMTMMDRNSLSSREMTILSEPKEMNSYYGTTNLPQMNSSQNSSQRSTSPLNLRQSTPTIKPDWGSDTGPVQ